MDYLQYKGYVFNTKIIAVEIEKCFCSKFPLRWGEGTELLSWGLKNFESHTCTRNNNNKSRTLNSTTWETKSWPLCLSQPLTSPRPLYLQTVMSVKRVILYSHWQNVLPHRQCAESHFGWQWTVGGFFYSLVAWQPIIFVDSYCLLRHSLPGKC